MMLGSPSSKIDVQTCRPEIRPLPSTGSPQFSCAVTWVNWRESLNADEQGRALDGLLALQIHVGQPMKMQFKNLLFKKLWFLC